MLLYNVTIGIDPQAEKEWLVYMKEKHIPSVMDTGMFVSSKMYRVLHDSDDGTISYSIQYFAANLDNVQQYLENFAPRLVEEHRRMFQNRHVAFRTLLQEV